MACMVIYFSEQFHHIAQKMDADPAYARQIVAKLRQWKEDYDRWDNTAAASYGGDVAKHQASKSYVFDLDENGDVRQDRLGI